MLGSTDRIMTTHAGALPRVDALRALVFARSNGEPYDKAALATSLRGAVAQTVAKQVELGIDSVNDGELGKSNFTNYIHERLAGIEKRPYKPGQDTGFTSLIRREVGRYGTYYKKMIDLFPAAQRPNIVCVGPLRYVGHDLVKEDIANFKAALAGKAVADAYLPAVTPGTIEHWLQNEFYPNDEAFLFAIADALRPEYQAIVEAGFTLQIDDPDLPDGWQIYPDMSVADYRKYADLRVAALNHALKGIAAEKVRLHVCWGSFHGPHQGDIGARAHRRHHLQGGGTRVLDRSLQPASRARVAGVRKGEAAGRLRADPGRGRPLHQFHRASRAGGAAPGPLRQSRRPRECRGRNGLRSRAAAAGWRADLGQAGVAGRGRAPRVKEIVGEGVTDQNPVTRASSASGSSGS